MAVRATKTMSTKEEVEALTSMGQEVEALIEIWTAHMKMMANILLGLPIFYFHKVKHVVNSS